MPNFKETTAAREKAKRIREHAAAFRQESARMEQASKDASESTAPVVIRRESSSKERVRSVGRAA